MKPMQVAYASEMPKTPSYTGPRFQRRQHWINILVGENGGPKAVGAIVDTPATYITAMCRGSRGVGDEIADRLERRFDKPNGWLDRPMDASSEERVVDGKLDLSAALMLIGASIEAAPEGEAKTSACAMLNSYLQRPSANADMVPLILKRLSGELEPAAPLPSRQKRA